LRTSLAVLSNCLVKFETSVKVVDQYTLQLFLSMFDHAKCCKFDLQNLSESSTALFVPLGHRRLLAKFIYCRLRTTYNVNACFHFDRTTVKSQMSNAHFMKG
jgi:hypothetical protein